MSFAEARAVGCALAAAVLAVQFAERRPVAILAIGLAVAAAALAVAGWRRRGAVPLAVRT